MEPHDIRGAIDGFIRLLERGQENNDEANARTLHLLLDQLALAYHYAESDLDCEDDAPSEDYSRLRQLAAQRFGQFGYYYQVSRTSKWEQEPTIEARDAVDDIADIARDLCEVRWYWDHECEKTALWQFRWGYENHWGEHMRSLQNYIYTLQHTDY